MDIRRIRQEIVAAKQEFEYLEGCYDSQGNPYARTALQTTVKRIYILENLLPGHLSLQYAKSLCQETSIKQ